MSEAICSACGAAIISGTGFCRRCGAPAAEGPSASEEPTAILNQPSDGTTQRLDPRPTSPGTKARLSESDELDSVPLPPGARPRKFLIVGLIILALLAFGSIAGVVRSVLKNRGESQSPTQISRALIYPGSKIVLDLTQDSGGGVLQLETSDPLQKVQGWYLANLKPDKILQATINSVILRKANTTATLLAENNTTTIVIKQSAR